MALNLGGTVGLAGLGAGGVVGGYVLHRFFLAEHCYGGGVPGPVPAPASIQGRICGPSDAPVTLVTLVFLGAAFLAVVALVGMWRNARDWVGKVVALMAPAAILAFTWGALVLPPDSCSDEQRKQESASRCATHSG
ncbi:MAG: hypothetical protein ACRDOM_08030 [Nocardioides sp.]